MASSLQKGLKNAIVVSIFCAAFMYVRPAQKLGFLRQYPLKEFSVCIVINGLGSDVYGVLFIELL
jgi:hypothetical protein